MVGGARHAPDLHSTGSRGPCTRHGRQARALPPNPGGVRRSRGKRGAAWASGSPCRPNQTVKDDFVLDGGLVRG